MSKVQFVQITDLHISDPGLNDEGLHSDTTATLAAIRDTILAMDPAPAFILATGDLTNHGDVASFRALKALMEPVAIPVVWTLGNHDTRPGFREGFLGETPSEATVDSEMVLSGVHVIALDTSEPGRIGGTLEPRQFAFLEAALDRHPDLPKVIAMHHAPNLDLDPDWEWESLTIADTLRLAETLRGRNVAGIFAGHIHQDRVSHWHGIPVVVGMGQHAAIDILHTGGLRLVAGASFALATLRPSGLTVNFLPLPSDRREIGRYDFDRLREWERMRREALDLQAKEA